jgi:hypothetical protein
MSTQNEAVQHVGEVLVELVLEVEHRVNFIMIRCFFAPVGEQELKQRMVSTVRDILHD